MTQQHDEKLSDPLSEKLSALQKLRALHQKYARYFPVAFFVGGVLFDILTLKRIDDWVNIAQQGAYLFLILQILKYRFLEKHGVWQPHKRFQFIWEYNNEILHFFLGSLLSFYNFFYFVSSSVSTSFIFILIIFSLLLLNESPRFKEQGIQLKLALFSICLFTYLFIIVPISIGFVGLGPFLLALAIGCVIIFTFYHSLTQLPLTNVNLFKTILLPPYIVAVSLILLYLLKIVPPIPLSLQYIGIYHHVEKQKVVTPEGESKVEFHLMYDRPRWRFWQRGENNFVAQPGDKIYCFIRIFAPKYFSDQIVFHWLKKGPDGWQTMDKITNQISGGREEGFRSFAIKSNFEPGEWRVQVETRDGQEIGRKTFYVEAASPDPSREFREDIF